MDLLLDAHTLLWWFADDPRLSNEARRLIRVGSNRVYVGSPTFWEISTKYRLGKLPGAELLLQDVSGYLARENFEVLDLSLEVAIRAGLLWGSHRDPFDRMLVAQALESDLLILSRDEELDGFGARCLW